MNMTSAAQLPDLNLGSIEQQIVAAETALAKNGALTSGKFPSLAARLEYRQAELAGTADRGLFAAEEDEEEPDTLDQAKAEIARLKGQLGKANPGAAALGEPTPRTLTSARLQIVNLHSQLSIATPAPAKPAISLPAVSRDVSPGTAEQPKPAPVVGAKQSAESDPYFAALAAAAAEPDPFRQGLLFGEARLLQQSILAEQKKRRGF